MRYLLDANVVIALLKRQTRVSEHVFRNKRRDHGLSSIVAHELLFGAFRSQRPNTTLAAFEALRLPVLDFTIDDARKAGEIRAILAVAGISIDLYNVLIAGQALARDLTLVTRNTREFGRFAGLRVEDWENGNP